MSPRDLYCALFAEFGPQHWWPGDTPFEIMVGAILTQRTYWSNAERAISNLKAEGMLSPGRILAADMDRLEGLIRPSGFYRQKAGYLQGFCGYLLKACGGDLHELFKRPLAELRAEFLAQRGIGPETADSMLLYAGNKATFVVDAYTVRICNRTGLLESGGYDAVKAFFESALPPDVKLYNEYHALLVRLGKELCRPRNPGCSECPVGEFCGHARAIA